MSQVHYEQKKTAAEMAAVFLNLLFCYLNQSDFISLQGLKQDQLFLCYIDMSVAVCRD